MEQKDEKFRDLQQQFRYAAKVAQRDINHLLVQAQASDTSPGGMRPSAFVRRLCSFFVDLDRAAQQGQGMRSDNNQGLRIGSTIRTSSGICRLSFDSEYNYVFDMRLRQSLGWLVLLLCATEQQHLR